MGIDNGPRVSRQERGEFFSTHHERNDVEEKILMPFNYVWQNRGKQFREKYIRAINHWVKASDKLVEMAIKNVLPFHDISLIIDDIQDNSTIRRGIPCAHIIYGVPRTLSAAALAIWVVLERTAKTDDLRKYRGFAQMVQKILECLRGQAMDIFWRETSTCPTEDEYLVMISQKTGTFFDIELGVNELLTKDVDDKTVTRIGELIGPLFQIRDDYINLCSEEYMKKKGFCEDLTEGKFSFPIIHAIQSHPEDATILNIVRQRTTDNELKRHCVSLMEKYDSFEYTRQRIKQMQAELQDCVERLGENRLFATLMDQMHLWHGIF